MNTLVRLSQETLLKAGEVTREAEEIGNMMDLAADIGGKTSRSIESLGAKTAQFRTA
jgi:hypothetical protein